MSDLPHPFDVATAITRTAEGRFGAEVDAGWSAPMGPNGGYLASIVLRAMTAAVDEPARAPRSLTLHYLRPPAPGPVDVVVVTERVGRSLTTLSARLEQDGRLCVLALAAFASDMPSAIDYAEPPPADVIAFAATQPAPIPDGAPPIVHRLDARQAIGGRVFSGAEEARTGGWLAFTGGERPVDAIACATFVDAWLPAPFVRLTVPIAAPTVELTVHFRARFPVDGPVLGAFTSHTSALGFLEEDGALWSAAGTLLAQSRQLALARPLS